MENTTNCIVSTNRIMLGDSYKYSHGPQYQKGAKNLYDYAEARSINLYDNTLFIGLQPILKTYFTKPITVNEVQEAEMYSRAHGIPFNKNGWMKIVEKYDGFIPVTIKAIPEGTLVPNKNVLFTITLTEDDADVAFVVSWFETFLMKVWYICNTATRSFYVKKMLMEEAKATSDKPFVDYQYHNFGDRGASSVESAYLGAIGHLACFAGTDNFNTIKMVNELYGVEDINTIGHSIPASEHSTVTSWGRDGEFEMVMNHLETFKDTPIIACVADSYDVYEFTNRITTGEFKEKIESEDYPIFVIRPDSGEPKEVISLIISIMERNNVQYTVNEKDYKVWNKYRIIWGDGINMETMQDILSLLRIKDYSSENVAFSSGGWLMQQHDRDTLGFAIKCSEITLADGSTRAVFKDPITDPGKKSKKGKVSTFVDKDGFYTGVIEDNIGANEILQEVFVNGKLNEVSFDVIRDRVNFYINKEIGA